MVSVKEQKVKQVPRCPLVQVDTACAKTEAGEDWEAMLLGTPAAQDLTLAKVQEQEPFRFCPGKNIDSMLFFCHFR